MKRTVYKAMDNELVFFGIRGSYRRLLFVGLVVVLIASLLFGAAGGLVVGILVFLLGVMAVYLSLIVLQEKRDYKSLIRGLRSRQFPLWVHVRRHISDQVLSSYED